ncbi:DUF5327 family protein [Exiguobacterium artemiae]
MITEQQVIEKMRQTMSKIEQTTGKIQSEHIAAMKAYCELLLDQPMVESATRSVITPVTEKKTPEVDPMLARFMGVAQEKEEKGPSLLDF